ncbi:hypothetical protein G7054_g10254 [Neopestalotiopsis clavispora]|nr:hypothetical protein G7054_g10254 [Neopestalotiopsis clavispora]
MDEKGSAGNGQGPKGPFAKLSDRQGPVLVGASTATSAHPWLPPRFGCFGMKRFAGRAWVSAAVRAKKRALPFPKPLKTTQDHPGYPMHPPNSGRHIGRSLLRVKPPAAIGVRPGLREGPRGRPVECQRRREPINLNQEQDNAALQHQLRKGEAYDDAQHTFLNLSRL